MNQADFPEFTALLDSVAALLGKPSPGTQQSAMFFRVLAGYPLDSVRQALDAHLRDPQRGRFFPAPADVIAKIEDSGPKHPSADEAWAIAIKARDEAETVVWTSQMAQAWGICKPVMDGGDEVGARMAFKSAYERITADAKRDRLPIQWVVSEGFDKERRIAAVQQAESCGLLLPSAAREALPLLEHHGAQIGPMPDHIREQLTALREAIVSKDTGPSRDELARQETERRKAETREQIEKYINQENANADSH